MSRKKYFFWHWELGVCLLMTLIGLGVFWVERLSLQHIQEQIKEEIRVSVHHAGVELGNAVYEEDLDKVKSVFEHILESDYNLTFLQIRNQDQRVVLEKRQRYSQGEVILQVPLSGQYGVMAGISDLPLRRIKERYNPLLVVILFSFGVFILIRRMQGGFCMSLWFSTKNNFETEEMEQTLQLYTYTWNKMEKERAMLANHLHEQIGQALSAGLIRLGMVPRQHALVQSAEINAASQEVFEVQKILQDSITEITGLTEQLRPSVLETLGLWPALRSYIRWFENHAGIWVELSAVGTQDMRFPTEIEILIFRIAQECLENVRCHAQAGLVEMTFCVCEHNLAVQIKDDGIGFNLKALNYPEKNPGGLSELKSRLQYYHGRLEIASEHGQGTAIKAHIPMSCAIKRRDDVETDSCDIGG